MKFKTKMNIFFIAIKLLLCVAIMVSSTYALFTDSRNLSVCVTAGGMDVKLLQWIPDEYVDISDRDGNVFGSELWEPGQTRIVFLKIENNSNIPIKYLLEMNVAINGLDGALEYCAFESKAFDTSGYDWEAVKKMSSVADSMTDGSNTISGDRHIYLEKGGVAYYALAVHMLESGSNAYQNQNKENGGACYVNIHLFAVQGNISEEALDSDAAAKAGNNG